MHHVAERDVVFAYGSFDSRHVVKAIDVLDLLLPHSI